MHDICLHLNNLANPLYTCSRKLIEVLLQVTEHYLKRQMYEEALLKYITDEFIFEDTEQSIESPEAEEVNLECQCLWTCKCTSQHLKMSLIVNRMKFPLILLTGTSFTISPSLTKSVLMNN